MSLIIALLKINITLAVCYSLFHFLLRKLTFYNLNRVFFLCAIALSTLMPFINIRLERAPVKTPVILNVSTEYPVQLAVRNTLGFTDLVQIIFWAGVVLMGLRMLVQLLSVGRLYLRSRENRIDGIPVRIMQSPNNPFSFFKSIFINPGLLPQDELQMVLRHEKVHARQWHSFDILIAEVNKAFCWFNPAAWLMMRAVRQNLEFIADREVLKKGTESRAYQYSLLRVSQAGHSVALTNNFNFSHLKTRIIMMNKRQSTPIHLMKYFAAAPLVAALVCCFGISSAQQKKLTIKETPQQEQRSEKEARLKVKPEAAMQKQEMPAPGKIKSVRITKTEHSVKAEGKEHKVAVVELESGETREIVLDQQASGKVQQGTDHPLIMLDGEKIPYAQMEEIDAKKIKSVTILKDASATAQYGAEARNGVIVITMKED